jgi:hypothetical protein
MMFLTNMSIRLVQEAPEGRESFPHVDRRIDAASTFQFFRLRQSEAVVHTWSLAVSMACAVLVMSIRIRVNA